MIDGRAVEQFLQLIGEKTLPKGLFDVVEIEDKFPVSRVQELLNTPKQ